jgi:hypothetical protein
VGVVSRGRGELLAAAAAFAVVLGSLLQLRFGYSAGTNDHLVLSLQGLQWAGHGALVDDWFIRSAPQPHILFDAFTWAGASTGHLSAFYLGWWLIGLTVGGSGTAVLAQAWTPRAPVLTSIVIAAVIGLGPQVVLGTTTPALPTALPDELAGFLAYLSAALLLTRRPRGAAIALVATSVVHVQIGAVFAVVAALAVVVIAVIERRLWWWPLAGVVISAAIVATVLRLRPVAGQGGDFIQICREVIPFHCDATTWSPGQLYSGFGVVAAALLSVAFAVDGRHEPAAAVAAAMDPPRADPPGAVPPGADPPGADPPGMDSRRADAALWGVTVVVPAIGLAGGVLANGYQVPVLGPLAQSTNVFRLGVLLVPFAAWGLVAGFHRLSGRSRYLWLLAALAAGVGWLVPLDGHTALPDAGGRAAVVLATAGVGVLVGPGTGGAHRRPRGRVASGAVGLLALGLLLAGAVQLGQIKARPVDIAFVSDPRMRTLGAVIDRHVPPGQVILAQPTWGVIRLAAGRSVVVDCKAVPYGGPAWIDYRTRLDAIGGRGGCSNGGAPYARVPATTLVAVANRYGARYLVMSARDPRRAQVLAEGWRVLATPYLRAADAWLLAGPGAPDAAAP